MDFYEGETVLEKIERGPLKLDEAIELAIQITEGLNIAHQKKIVHRDLKPANVLVTEQEVAKIVDFGLAKLAGRTMLTKEGTTLGTVAYMSPEQTQGIKVDQRTDIWALGAVIYEMITGQQPFRGDYEQAVTYSIMNEDPEPPTSLRTGVPMELERIVFKALAKEPGERYQHVDEMLVDLSAVSKRSESGSSKEPKTLTNPVSRRRFYPYAGLSTLAAILLLMFYFWPVKGDGIDSIAVLPLQNLSGDSEREFFADGLTESLIMELSKISALRVISKQSVMRYKQTEKSMPEIASELNVAAVVEGSALRIGDEVRITVQLIQAEPEQHLWAEQYDRPMQDILRLQSDVAQAIAKEIKIVVTPEESERLVSTAAINPAAHEFYLKGRFYLDKLEKTSLLKAIESFQNAIDIEKEYALAYVGQAEAYGWLVHLGEIPPSEGFQNEKKLALQAIDIGGELAEAYTLLGELSEWALWDWETGRRYLEKAIALNRNYARARSGYAWYLLRRRGQTEQALIEIGIACGLDPYSNRIKYEYGLMLYFARRYEDAIRVLQELLEVSPDYTEAPVLLGHSYMRIGRYQDAIKQIQDFTALTGDTLTALSQLIPVYTAMGDTMKALELFGDYMTRLEETKVSMFGKEAPTVAGVYARGGEKLYPSCCDPIIMIT